MDVQVGWCMWGTRGSGVTVVLVNFDVFTNIKALWWCQQVKEALDKLCNVGVKWKKSSLKSSEIQPLGIMLRIMLLKHIRNQTQQEHDWQQNRLAATSTLRWLHISYGNHCMTKVRHILPFQGRSNRMSKEERKSLHKLMSHPCCHRSLRVVATWNVLSNSWKQILSGSPPEPTLLIPTRGMLLFISSSIFTNWSNKNGWKLKPIVSMMSQTGSPKHWVDMLNTT